MSIAAQQVVSPPVSDPNAVAETFVNGPINMNIIGSVATLTFTTVRLNVVQAFTGNKADFSAVVVSRLSMPLENLLQLRDMLSQAILKAPPIPMTNGSQLKQ
jgi:hypothetical protein